MKYYGTVADPNDLATKEYVDEHTKSSGVTGIEVKGLAQNSIEIGNVVYNITATVQPETIPADASGNPFSANFFTKASFNPAGTLMVLTGSFPGGAKLYSVSGLILTYVSDIYADNNGTALSSQARCAVFSPDGSLLIVGGLFTGYCKAYSVSGTTLTYLYDLSESATGTAISKYIMSATINPDGNLLVLGGYHSGKILAYTLSGTTVTFLSMLSTNTGQCTLVKFSPDGKYLFANVSQDYYLWYFKVTGQTFESGHAFGTKTTFNGSVNDIALSDDMKKLVVCGAFNLFAKYYKITYDAYGNISFRLVSELKSNASGAYLNAAANSVSFSPDNSQLLLGGNFTKMAKVYSVEEDAIPFKADLLQSGNVWGVSYSPNGAIAVLTGHFTEKARKYCAVGSALIDGSFTAVYNALATPHPDSVIDIGISKENATVGNVVNTLKIASGLVTKEYIDQKLTAMLDSIQT